MPNPRVISFKCKCFRTLGRRFVYPRNDVIKESIRFDVESLQTSSKYYFGPPSGNISQKIGPLSARPSRIHSGQRVAIAFPSGPVGGKIKVYLGWFEIPAPIEIKMWEGASVSTITEIVLDMPTIPKDRWLELRIECNGVVISKPIWSNGSKIEGRWNSNYPAVDVDDYCCRGSGGDGSVDEPSHYTYNDVGGDICRVVALTFVTLNGIINGSNIINLSNYRNVGLPIHTRWSIEEVGYYGLERPVVYNWGEIVNGELIGLPDHWSPPVYGYTGYMNLTLRC
jgi:hypothetical protein